MISLILIYCIFLSIYKNHVCADFANITHRSPGCIIYMTELLQTFSLSAKS